MWDSVVSSVARSLVLAAAEGASLGASEGAGPAPDAEPAANPLKGMLIFFIAMLAIMWFVVFRPQGKQEKMHREMLATLSKGDRVLMKGGMLGTVVGLSEKTIVLRVSDDPPVKIEFLRTTVAKKLSSESEQGDEEDKK